MATLILSIVIFVIVVGAMAIGVILGRKPIKGSCGGMSSLGMDTACDICGGDTKKCEEEQDRQNKQNTQQKNAQTDLAYEADAQNKNSKQAK